MLMRNARIRWLQSPRGVNSCAQRGGDGEGGKGMAVVVVTVVVVVVVVVMGDWQ
jgi:predicted metalloprotease